MKCSLIGLNDLNFKKLRNSQFEKFNLWPVNFDECLYNHKRIINLNSKEIIFIGCIKNGEVVGVLEFHFSQYDTNLRGFNCGVIENIFFDKTLTENEIELCAISLFDCFGKFRKEKKITFCLLALSAWDSNISKIAQDFSFSYVLTWGKCFFEGNKNLDLPKDYKINHIKEPKYLPAALEMVDYYFEGGRFYLDQKMDRNKNNEMYKDLIKNAFSSDNYIISTLINKSDELSAILISNKAVLYSIKTFSYRALRLLASNPNKLEKGVAVRFFNICAREYYEEDGWVESGIEMHNLKSLKIHVDAGFKFNYIYSAYHSWI